MSKRLPGLRLRSLRNDYMMPFDFMDSLINGRSRRVANQTYVIPWGDPEQNGVRILRHWATDIIIAHRNGNLLIDTGGHHSSTTKRRLNLVLPDSIAIWAENDIWRIRLGSDRAEFYHDKTYIGFHDRDWRYPYFSSFEQFEEEHANQIRIKR